MAKHRTDQEWASILSAFRRSGQSQAAFCRRRGLALSTFRLRLAAARRNATPLPTREDGGTPLAHAALLELPLLGSHRAEHRVPVELEFPGGVRASLAVSNESLADLLAELHRLPRP